MVGSEKLGSTVPQGTAGQLEEDGFERWARAADMEDAGFTPLQLRQENRKPGVQGIDPDTQLVADDFGAVHPGEISEIGDQSVGHDFEIKDQIGAGHRP
jgi:hypothetical protein